MVSTTSTNKKRSYIGWIFFVVFLLTLYTFLSSLSTSSLRTSSDEQKQQITTQNQKAFKYQNQSLVDDNGLEELLKRTRPPLGCQETMVYPPQVTIIIPAENSEWTLQDTVESIVRQTYPFWEVVIVDEGSEDKTSLVARQLALYYSKSLCTEGSHPTNPLHTFYQNVRYVWKWKTMGTASAINLGMNLAQASWTLVVLPGDYLQPRLLEVFMEAAKNKPDANLIYTTSNKSPSCEKFGEKNGRVPCCGMLKKEKWALGGGYDDHLYLFSEWELWNRLELSGRLGGYHCISEERLFYREDKMVDDFIVEYSKAQWEARNWKFYSAEHLWTQTRKVLENPIFDADAYFDQARYAFPRDYFFIWNQGLVRKGQGKSRDEVYLANYAAAIEQFGNMNNWEIFLSYAEERFELMKNINQTEAIRSMTPWFLWIKVRWSEYKLESLMPKEILPFLSLMETEMDHIIASRFH